MTTSLVRRSVALLASGGAAAALTLIPSAAHANVSAQFEAVGEASASYTGTGGGSCTLSSGDSSPTSTPVAFHHGTKTRSVKLNATFTNSLDSTDQVQVKGHVDSSLSLKRKGGDLASLDLAAGGAITIQHTITGSQCRASGELFGAIPNATFTESKKGTLALSWNSSQKGALIEFVVFDVTTNQAILVTASVADHMKGSAQVTLKPGKYGIAETEAGLIAGAVFTKRAALVQKTKLNVDVQATFTPKKH